MKRDPLILVPAVLLALLALPAAGWVEAPKWMPATPWGYLPIALGLAAVFVVGIATEGLRRTISMAAVAAPFVAFGVLASPGSAGLDLRWVSFGALALLVSVLPKRARPWAQAIGATVLIGGAVLLTAGLDVLPRTWTPLANSATDTTPAPTAHVGIRKHAPTRVETTPLGQGNGPWWVSATRAQRTGPRPHVCVMDGTEQKPTLTLQGMTVWHAGARPTPDDVGTLPLATDGMDLDSFDALYVTEQAWLFTDPKAEQYAVAIAQYVRAGGTLIGVGLDEDWPEGLGRRLGAAGAGNDLGAEHARTLGLGRVLRVADRQGAVRALTDDDVWVRDVTTVFRDGGRPATLPDGLSRWTDDPAPRKPAGIVLLLVAGALLVFFRLLSGPLFWVGAIAVGLAGVAALIWLIPTQPTLHAEGLRFDLGGTGARRVDAVWLSAGPTGFRGRIQWQGRGHVRLLGASLDATGRVVLAPEATGWAVRTDRVRAGVEDSEARDAAFLLELLDGPVVPARVRLGRGTRLPVSIEGLDSLEARSLRYRAVK